MDKKHKDYVYITILSITIFLIILAIMYCKYLNRIIIIPDCTIYNKLGIYCPACGSTRAVYSLVKLDIAKSIYYNPIIFYILFVALWYIITEGISKILKKENKLFIKNVNIYLIIGLIILIANWIIKNVLLFQGIKM